LVPTMMIGYVKRPRNQAAMLSGNVNTNEQKVTQIDLF